MLIVKTRIGPSRIHGTGLFTLERIPKDGVIWRYRQGFDLRMSREEFIVSARHVREDWLRFAYVSRFSGLLVRSADDYVWMNHSHEANVGVSPIFEPPEGYDIALRDIEAGEELSFDYSWFGEDPCCRPEVERLPEDINGLRPMPLGLAR